MKIHSICGLLLVIGLASDAQAAEIQITLTTVPAGAAVTVHGQTWQTPHLITNIPKPTTGCADLDPFTFTWLSGAQDVERPRICADTPKKAVMRVTRPAGTPGVETDLQYAAQLQQFAVLQAQMRVQAFAAQNAQFYATQRQIMQNTFQALMNQSRTPLATPAYPQTRNCTSQIVGDTVYTNCH